MSDPMLSDEGSFEPRKWPNTSASDEPRQENQFSFNPNQCCKKKKKNLPVRVETGLVLFDASPGSKLASDDEALLSWLEREARWLGARLGGDCMFRLPRRAESPSSSPSRMYKSFCDDFFDDTAGFIVPPSSSNVKRKINLKIFNGRVKKLWAKLKSVITITRVYLLFTRC